MLPPNNFEKKIIKHNISNIPRENTATNLLILLSLFKHSCDFTEN